MVKVLGIGTGRCGTVSLATLLNSQPDSAVTHESVLLPWEITAETCEKAKSYIAGLSSGGVCGDVSFSWVRYTPFLMQEFPDLKVVALSRDKEQVIDSYLKKVGLMDHWHPSPKYPSSFDGIYPSFVGATKRDRLSMYCDLYKSLIDKLCFDFGDRICRMKMEDLNTVEGVGRLLAFLGVENPVVVHPWRNQGPK